jgi:hypothetical protein
MTPLLLVVLRAHQSVNPGAAPTFPVRGGGGGVNLGEPPLSLAPTEPEGWRPDRGSIYDRRVPGS